MRPIVASAAFLAFLGGSVVSAAEPVRLLATDDRGVTLQLDLPASEFRSRTDGRSELTVAGLRVVDVPGRPHLPYAVVLIALPPGARANVRMIAGAPEGVQNVRLSLGERPVFRGDPGARDLVPARETVPPILDGVWPPSPAELGEPFSLRRQRLVAVSLQPFRYDEMTGRLWSRQSLTVRVDFVGVTRAGSSEQDPHWDPVLRAGVLNFEQAQGWREPVTQAEPRESSTRLPTGPLDRFNSRAQSTISAAALAFDESFPEVRVRIDTTGVYQLDYATLAANGYPANTPIGQVSVHRHEFVEGSSPPYATIELPIEVDDRNSNTVFDTGDRIILFVQSWAERSRASHAQRAWGDAEVIYATAVSGAGLRPATRPGWRNTVGLTPLTSYPWTQRWEKNFAYFPFPPDTLADQIHWTEISTYYERADSLQFETNHLDTTRAVTVALSWMGRRDSPHYSWGQYHAGSAPFLTVADSLVWFGRGSVTAAVTLPGSTLGEGNVNTVRIWGKSGGPPDPQTNATDNVGLNWIQATYWRGYRPLADYLSCNSADATGEIQISAPTFTLSPPSPPSTTSRLADFLVYDVTDTLNPTRLTLDTTHVTRNGSQYTIEFQDSIAAGAPHRYVVTTGPRIPPPANFGAVTRQPLTARTTGDYLVIVPEAFLPAMDPLIQLRQSQGLEVVVAPFEAVCDQFNGGRKSSYAIKRFTRYAYDNWNARFVLLVGDGSEDPRNFSNESSPDWIPIQKINGPVAIQFGYEVIPSDPWYVCMNNCDFTTFVPALQDMFIGRLPAGTLAQAQDMVAKVVAYENVTPDQTWRRNILLNADDDYSSVTFFGGGGAATIEYCRRPSERVFEQLNLVVADVILNRAGLRQAVIDTFFLSRSLEGVACKTSVPGDTCVCKEQSDIQQITHSSITGPLLISRLNQGRLWWNFQGHANEFVLAHEDLYVNRGFTDDKDLLLNDGRPFLFSAFSCHANAFARYGDQSPGRGPALGEEMVLLPARGAIASWASSGYEILPFGGNSHINVELARALFEAPPHDEYLGSKGARVVLGEAIALALARYVPGVQFNPNEKGIALSYQLIGDPATTISIGEPQAVVLANQLPVVDGQPVRLHTMGDTLRIEADLVSNVEFLGLALDRTDAAGTVTIAAADYTLTPAFPDTAASGLGGRRYHLSYGTTLAADSYRYTLRTLDRYNVPGDFDVSFQFLTQLRVDDAPIADGDPVAPTANLSLRVLSPRPLVPLTDLTLTVNGVNQPFAAAPVAGDASGREWTLSWTHVPYAIDDYDVRLAVTGGTAQTRRFSVVVGANELNLRNLVAFPNPFDDTGGTAFSFLLTAAGPADLQIRVFTPAGRLVYERLERGLAPGYHQLPWSGLDAEGDKLANGVYFYRMLVSAAGTQHEQIGRLVKLRRPRRAGNP